MAERITRSVIKELIPPIRGNRISYDSEIPGFGVRITAAGAVSFVLNYRIHGRERRYTIGRHPELTATAAREIAIQLRGQILNGQDPLDKRERDRTEFTIGELASEYLDRYAVHHKRPSSLRNDRQMIDRFIRPRLGNFRIHAVGKRDISEMHASLKATPYQANRVLALLSKMFSLASEWGMRSDNPVQGMPRYSEDQRERWLSISELQRLTEALAAYKNQNAADALRLLLLSGARENEVLKADWTQFDLERGIWTKPSHHTKEKRTEHVPLNELAIELLRRMKPEKATGPLFPGRSGNDARKTIHRPWIQVCKTADLVTVIEIPGKRIDRKTGKPRMLLRYKPTLRLHDLRHTFASHLVSMGAPLQIVGKLLGHTQAATTMRYAHLADQPVRTATNAFGEIVNEVLKTKCKN